MKTLLLLAILILCLTQAVPAAISGFAATLPTGASSYSVPTNKTLVLQQVALPQGAGLASYITITPSGGQPAAVTIPGANTNGLYTFSRPLILPAGTAISAPFNGNNTTGLYGLLVDASDLYLFVGVPSILQNLAFSDGILTGTLQLATADPVTVRFQTSTNLVDWQFDNTVAVQRSPDKSKLLFTASTTRPHCFYRALIRRRSLG